VISEVLLMLKKIVQVDLHKHSPGVLSYAYVCIQHLNTK